MTEGVFESESERIASTLRDEILDGVRAPGSRLVEREIAAHLGVSRIPVRDALRVLVTEGLVTLRPRSWAVVREFGATELADFNEVRAVLDVLVFRLAAERRTRRGLDKLKANLDAELAAARTGNALAARRAAADFHMTVISLAANELLSELGHGMRSRIRWLFARHDDLLALAKEHQELYAAIADRDADRVVTLVTRHIDRGRTSSRQHDPKVS